MIEKSINYNKKVVLEGELPVGDVEDGDGGFTCGGDLVPTFDPQTLVSPTNQFGRYDNNARCKVKKRQKNCFN
jgi:hypothetical protein